MVTDGGEARRRLGIGELGSWGVVGHGGVESLSALAKTELVELSGSNMADLDVNSELSGLAFRSELGNLKRASILLYLFSINHTQR